MLRYDISMDLCKDYSQLVLVWMKRKGVVSNKTGWDLWYEFFNLQKKTIKPRTRKVNFSKEFFCPKNHQQGLDILLKKFERGENVIPHLSKNARIPSQFDGLLYDWGIHHFHLGTTLDPKTGRAQRTGPILFAKVDESNVYCINVYSHGKGVAPPWSKSEMIKILHRNWPETISQYRLPDVTSIRISDKYSPTDDEYSKARKSHMYTLVEAEENAIYAPLGGGQMSSGHSAEIVSLCDSIWNTLKRTEIYIKEHITSFVAAVEDVTGESPVGKLYFKLWNESGQLYVVDLRSLVALIKVEI